MVTTPQGKWMELRQACDFGVYYVIYVNILKMEVIYGFFLEVIMLHIFLKSGVNFFRGYYIQVSKF